MTKQIAFSFSPSSAHNTCEYIESGSNILAHNAIMNWPTCWGLMPYPKTLIIQGPESCGKTLLAKKWAIESGALFIKKTDEFTENMLLTHQAFIIDGLDDTWREEMVLHCFNSIYENNKYLLITASQIPEIQLADLTSRIKASQKVIIDLPDDQLMTILIFKLFSNYSVVIRPEIIKYLIKVLPRTFAKIIRSVEIINDFALEHKRKITMQLVKQALESSDK